MIFENTTRWHTEDLRAFMDRALLVATTANAGDKGVLIQLKEAPYNLPWPEIFWRYKIAWNAHVAGERIDSIKAPPRRDIIFDMELS